MHCKPNSKLIKGILISCFFWSPVSHKISYSTTSPTDWKNLEFLFTSIIYIFIWWYAHFKSILASRIFILCLKTGCLIPTQNLKHLNKKNRLIFIWNLASIPVSDQQDLYFLGIAFHGTSTAISHLNIFRALILKLAL